MIQQHFNKFLLMNWLERLSHRVETEIKPLAEKKLKQAHIGRRREFVILLMKFNEVYERKKAEEADYQAALKKKIEERPRFPASSGTMRFKRIQPKEGFDE